MDTLMPNTVENMAETAGTALAYKSTQANSMWSNVAALDLSFGSLFALTDPHSKRRNVCLALEF